MSVIERFEPEMLLDPFLNSTHTIWQSGWDKILDAFGIEFLLLYYDHSAITNTQFYYRRQSIQYLGLWNIYILHINSLDTSCNLHTNGYNKETSFSTKIQNKTRNK